MKVNYEQEFKRILATVGLMAVAQQQAGNVAVAESLVGLFHLMDAIENGEVGPGLTAEVKG